MFDFSKLGDAQVAELKKLYNANNWPQIRKLVISWGVVLGCGSCSFDFYECQAELKSQLLNDEDRKKV